MLQTVPQSNARPFLIHAKVDLCTIKEAGKILGKKWYLVIVHRLVGRQMGFNELRDAVGGISAKILSQALKDLVDKGIVERRVASESPIRVEYSLTSKGTDLQTVLGELQGWGKRWDICREADHRPHAPNTRLVNAPAVAQTAPEPPSESAAS